MLNDTERTIIRWEALKAKARGAGLDVKVNFNSEPNSLVVCQEWQGTMTRVTSLEELEGFIKAVSAMRQQWIDKRTKA